MNTLTNSEIENIIEKIRFEYKENSKIFPKFFKIQEFENRLRQIHSMKGNISLFLRDEINHLKNLKLKKEEFIKLKEIKSNPTMEKILKEIEAKINKYPSIHFHILEDKELTYFYGAVEDLYRSDLILLFNKFSGTNDFNRIKESFYNVEKFAQKSKNSHSITIQNLISILNNPKINKKQIDSEIQNILKSVSKELTKIYNWCKETIQTNKNLPIFESKKIEIISMKIKEILFNFRMESISGFK